MTITNDDDNNTLAVDDNGIPVAVHRDYATSVHPDFPHLSRRLRLARESYEGSGGYAPYVEDVTIADTQPDDQQGGSYKIDTGARTHLFKHPREKKKFHRRVIMAYLTNVIKRALNMLNGFLTKQQPKYDKYPQPVKDWMSKVNVAGDNWEQFKEHEILPPLGYYGWLPIAFFHPATQESTETTAQQDAAGGSLTCEVICPENIVDWLASADGGFVWLKVKTQVDLTGPLNSKHVLVDRYTWYTQQGWFAVDDTGDDILPVAASGLYQHGLPIVVWRLRGGALTADADAIQREMFNVASLIQEQERGTAFAMLKAPDDGARDRNKEVGSENVWWFPHDAVNTPEWMEPPGGVLEHLMAKNVQLAGDILANMGLDFDQGGGQTGMAFQFKMSKIVRLLQGIANSLSRGDTRSLGRVAQELGQSLQDDVRVVWPSEFDAKDVEKEMDGLQRVLDSTVSLTAKIEADNRMVLAAIGDMDEKKRTAILKEIEVGRKQQVEQQELDEDNKEELEAKAEEDRVAANEPDPDDEQADDIQADGSAR